QYVRLQYYILPNVSAFPQGAVADGYAYAWNVPADDTHHWVYQISVSRGAPVDRDRLDRMNAQVLTADSRLKYGSANRYGQDREEMRSHTYSGMGRNFLVQDTFAVESPGPIQNRAKERLGTSDKAIIAARRLLLDAVEAVQAGREPPHVVRSADANG